MPLVCWSGRQGHREQSEVIGGLGRLAIVEAVEVGINRIIISSKQAVAMNKIDRIRRKLEENKRKSIFQEITINNHLTYTPKPTAHSHLHHPNTLSVFPIISKTQSFDTSTNHSDRSLTSDPFLTDSGFTGRRGYGSIFLEKTKAHSRKQRLTENVDELAAKTLTPAARSNINWAAHKKAETTPLKMGGSCLINAQTPIAVVILTQPPTPSGRNQSTLFRRTLPKQQAVANRKAYTPPEKGESPTRKFSISAWETYDEE